MEMAYFNGQFSAEPVKSLAFGSIVAGYSAIGTAFIEPSSSLYIFNNTNEALMFSLDGVKDHLPLPRYSAVVLDITANKSNETNMFRPEGAPLYVKRIGVPTSGSVYVTSFYG